MENGTENPGGGTGNSRSKMIVCYTYCAARHRSIKPIRTAARGGPARRAPEVDVGRDREFAVCCQCVCVVRELRQVPLHLVEYALFPQTLRQPKPSKIEVGIVSSCRDLVLTLCAVNII